MLTQTANHTSLPSNRLRGTVVARAVDGASERKPLAQTIRIMGVIMLYPRNAEIFGENEAADYVYKVVSGGVRTYKILRDGRRRIGGFYLPGDISALSLPTSTAVRQKRSLMPRCCRSSARP
jgi:CRP/FNR family nitrogen fixation transcriptional regulator